MSTELDVLEGCSPRTGTRDLERGSWVRSGTRSLFLVLKVIIVHSAFAGLGVTREPIKTTCVSVSSLLKSCPWRASCTQLVACLNYFSQLSWLMQHNFHTHGIFSLSKQIWHDVCCSAVVKVEQWNFVFPKAPLLNSAFQQDFREEWNRFQSKFGFTSEKWTMGRCKKWGLGTSHMKNTLKKNFIKSALGITHKISLKMVIAFIQLINPLL